MNNPKLAMIPSGYNAADAKLYSILPSDGSGDFTVSVDADATRVNKDGLIKGVALNQARLTYDPLNPECPSLLLEPTVTNNFTYSQDYSQSVWFKSNSTITSFVSISPNGELNASLLTSTGFNGGLFRFASWTTTQRTISFFVKKDNSETVQIYNASASTNNVVFNLDTGVVISEGGSMTGIIKSYSNNWYRISATHTAAGSQTFGIKPEILKSVYVWGGQMEDNSFETSYIPTTAIATSRTNDVCGNAGNATLFGGLEGAMFVDIKKAFKDSNFGRISISDGSTNNRVVIGKQSSNTQFRLFVAHTSGTVNAEKYTNVDYDVQNKFAISWKLNDFKFYKNGVLIHSDTLGAVPIGLSKFAFNENNLGSQDFFGEINEVRYYDKVLTEAEAIKLTTI